MVTNILEYDIYQDHNITNRKIYIFVVDWEYSEGAVTIY